MASDSEGGNNSGANSGTSGNAGMPVPAVLFSSGRPPALQAALEATENTSATPTPLVPPSVERRRLAARYFATRRPDSGPSGSIHSNDYDSDDDFERERVEAEALRFAEQYPYSRDMDEARIRAHQLFRGQLSNKRVASKRALSQLQSVAIGDLEDNARSKAIYPFPFPVDQQQSRLAQDDS
jgi:hypothetical protein